MAPTPRERRAGRIAFWIHVVLIVAAIAGCVVAAVAAVA